MENLAVKYADAIQELLEKYSKLYKDTNKSFIWDTPHSIAAYRDVDECERYKRYKCMIFSPAQYKSFVYMVDKEEEIGAALHRTLTELVIPEIDRYCTGKVDAPLSNYFMPMDLRELQIHIDPPGTNGYLVEGKVIYDIFKEEI